MKRLRLLCSLPIIVGVLVVETMAMEDLRADGQISPNESKVTVVDDLRCEYVKDPVGIDVAKPRLSWIINSGFRGVTQKAYQVLAASSKALLDKNQGNLWDSGKVYSDESATIEYAGSLLQSSESVWWKVRVWDAGDRSTAWSADAKWGMGFLQPGDWKAKWIIPQAPEGIQSKETFTLGKATYETDNGVTVKDVTDIVATKVKDGGLEVEVIPSNLGGDPAPGVRKKLLVEYALNGVNRSTEAEDFATVKIGSSFAPGPMDEPYVRKVFTLDGNPQEATARVNVMGWFELYVNGVKVGKDVMSPAIRDYQKRSLYLTYDLKPYLKKGPNCIGLWLSRGWYWQRDKEKNGPYDRPVARMQVDMSVDGKPLMIGTDSSWRCRTSGRNITGGWSWGNFGGERVEAWLDVPQWSSPNLDAANWVPVSEVPDPGVTAEAQRDPPDCVIKTFPALSCTDLGNGRYVLDFGSNLTGWLKLKFPLLKEGQVVTIHYTDMGPRDFESFNQEDQFVSAGKEGEVFIDKFNYKGFRYVTVDLPSAPALSDAQAFATGADWEPNGNFECSNALINKMHEVNVWTLHCLSLNGYMSDCPHRERMGYGDGQVSIDSCIMNFAMQPFYEKWMTDWRDVQSADGYLPHIAPQTGGGGGPAWGGGLQQLAWHQYQYYNDRKALEENYDPCRRYVECLESHEKDGILRAFGQSEWDDLGDWVPPAPLNSNLGWNFPSRDEADFFNNCYLAYLLDQLSRMAAILGKTDEAQAISGRANALRTRVQQAFFKPGQNFYVNDKQSYLVMPLFAEVTPEDLRNAVNKTLENSILVKDDGHLGTGSTATYFLVNYLQDIGRNDLLWKMVTQTSYPGWGYMLDQGATTWWEKWNGDGGTTHIHSCFTSLDSWFYQGLAGIRPDDSGAGFKKIIIKPAIVGDLTWVKGSYNSIHGEIVSNWTKNEMELTMEVTIPPNTTATVYVPAKSATEVTESGRPASQARGMKFLGMKDSAAVYSVGSGAYRLQSALP
jgi:alpha-L-rhamnosidase